MPKASRRRSGGHEQSVRTAQRQFAAQSSVEHVEIGNETEKSAAEILESMTTEESGSNKPLKKKEKQAMKHELFMQRLESSRQPYSKSHERRLKRKAREQVAGGLQEIQAAIAEVAGDDDSTLPQNEGETDSKERPKASKSKSGLIGEGKSAPLSQYQRKRALQTEKLRIPLILSNPSFGSNPFQTIRTHAQNTLVKHQQGE